MSIKFDSKEKVCAFYASDYHFEMITLPFICKNMDDSKEVILLTENNLEETVKTLLSRMNFDENRKNEILDIDWKDNDLKKFKQIKKNVKEQKDTVVFIKGKENYIKNANKNLENWLANKEKLEIVDCYDVGEIGENIDNVMDKYGKVLGTSGEREI